jgi:hypothetical protein
MILGVVPDAGRRERLLGIHREHVLDVRADEVDRLSSGVAIGFAPGLRQLQHRRSNQPITPGSRFEQVGRACEGRAALLPVEPTPPMGGLGRGFDCPTDVFSRRAMDLPQQDGVRMRDDDRHRAPGHDLPAADEVRDIVGGPADFSQRGGARRRRCRAGERAVSRQVHGGSVSWGGSAGLTVGANPGSGPRRQFETSRGRFLHLSKRAGGGPEDEC